jgi:REP element-mobilizing transposase RayT
MARPLRIEYPGALYHVTARGNARQDIFRDQGDYLEFLNVLCSVAKRFNWLIYAYCLIGNHYHLLIETPDGNLSTGMRQLNGVYSQRYNRRHKQVGHLMQGRYKAIIVDKETYLAELSRYIVLNPVRVGISKRPEQWKWSSYRSTAGIGKGAECLRDDWLLRYFGKTRTKSQQKYQEFVHDGIDGSTPWTHLVGQVLLGNEEFTGKIKGLLAGKDKIQEIPKAQRYSTRPQLQKILKTGRKGKITSDAVYEAHVKYGYTLKEIAKVIGVHYTTVSRLVSKAMG